MATTLTGGIAPTAAHRQVAAAVVEPSSAKLPVTQALCQKSESCCAQRAVTCAAVYFATSAIAIGGITLGFGLRDTSNPLQEVGGLVPFRNWDGAIYRQIADQGYTYRGPRQRATLAFFPAYPLLARGLKILTGVPTDVTLLAVSHGCLIAAFIVVGAYGAARRPETSAGEQSYCILALGLLPTTLFFRAAYSESLLLLLVALLLYGMLRRWPLVVLALIAGLASATRGPGVALVVPLLVHGWRRLGEGPGPQRLAVRITWVAALGVLSCWGLLVFMAYQWHQFGDPLGFAKLQYHWLLRHGEHASELRKLWALVTLEPIWAVYVPSKTEYWARYDTLWAPISLQFANPIYFVATVVLVLVGWRKKWLNDYEVLLSAGLLLIPYVTKSYDNAMASFGRFAAVVLPAYIVMGQLLARLRWPVAVAILGVSAVLIGVYSALFAAGYRLI